MKNTPHLQICAQRLFWNHWYWTVYLRDDIGGRKRLGGFDDKHECRAFALAIADRLHIPIRGKYSGFYLKAKRADAARVQQRHVARTSAVRNSRIATTIGTNACRTVEIHGGVYRCAHSKRLLRIRTDGDIEVVRPSWLRWYFDQHMRFVKGGKEVKCPAWIPKFVLAQWRYLHLPVLDVFATRQALPSAD